MAKIKQVGPGRKTSGNVDGLNYYNRKGKTFVRTALTMPESAYKTPAARKRQAVFILVQMHMKYHHRTIKQTFTPRSGTASNRYYSMNARALAAALDEVADRYVAGELITITDVEAAISAYAAEHPQAITIASKSGYQDVYLTGVWPETITLNALTGDSTVIIIVAENGTTTTINADGTVTTGTNSGHTESSGSGSTGSGDNSSSGDSGSGESGGGSSDSGGFDIGN